MVGDNIIIIEYEQKISDIVTKTKFTISNKCVGYSDIKLYIE